jgi:hypothetical protein
MLTSGRDWSGNGNEGVNKITKIPEALLMTSLAINTGYPLAVQIEV